MINMGEIQMNTNRDLNYQFYIQKINGFTRTSFQSEIEKYMSIQSGDVQTVKKNFESIRENFMIGKGRLSDDPVKNIRYHFIIANALTSRICIEGGLKHDIAYTLSDIYIQRADKCESYEGLLDLFEEMQVDFAQRMQTVKKENVISIHIRKCIDYIYEHLHEKISLTELASLVSLNPSYLSKLFLKETGVSIKGFILNAKISTAENMLKFSDFSYLEVSLALGFSSQSSFISVFRKITGVTPKVYRQQNYVNNITTLFTKNETRN